MDAEGKYFYPEQQLAHLYQQYIVGNDVFSL